MPLQSLFAVHSPAGHSAAFLSRPELGAAAPLALPGGARAVAERAPTPPARADVQHVPALSLAIDRPAPDLVAAAGFFRAGVVREIVGLMQQHKLTLDDIGEALARGPRGV